MKNFIKNLTDISYPTKKQKIETTWKHENNTMKTKQKHGKRK